METEQDIIRLLGELVERSDRQYAFLTDAHKAQMSWMSEQARAQEDWRKQWLELTREQLEATRRSQGQYEAIAREYGDALQRMKESREAQGKQARRAIVIALVLIGTPALLWTLDLLLRWAGITWGR